MKKELLQKTRKKELLESDLKTRLSVILSHNHGLYTTFGATRLEDLLEIDYETLVQAENEGKIMWLNSIRRCIHIYGCTLKGEYSDLDISEEEALIPIDALEIPTRVKTALKRTGCINVLGDLLSVPYSKIANLRGMGEKSETDLRLYLESLGYNVTKQENSIAERKAKLEEAGELLVDGVIESRKIMLALNRAGIYTVDELLERDLSSIPGIGKVHQQEIVTSLKDYICQENQEELEKESELARLSQEREKLHRRNIELRLEQIEVTEKLRQVEAEIRSKKAGIQYEKK